jgi:hypothetical protein
MPPGLIRDCNMARNIYTAYRSRQHAENMAEWATDNPEASKMLANAHEEYNAWAEDQPWLGLEGE